MSEAQTEQKKPRAPVQRIIARRLLAWMREQETRHNNSLQKAVREKRWTVAGAYEEALVLLTESIRDVEQDWVASRSREKATRYVYLGKAGVLLDPTSRSRETCAFYLEENKAGSTLIMVDERVDHRRATDKHTEAGLYGIGCYMVAAKKAWYADTHDEDGHPRLPARAQ